MTEKDYAETLFQAMNVLIDKKIETVKFDETIVATIVDASKAESGQYIVSTGNAKFIAYSTETRYKENTAVMVTIPQGNYDNQKMIIGKAVDNANTPMIYKSPLQSLINVSNNLIPKDVGITSFWANSEDAYLGRYWNIGQSSFKDAAVYVGDESEEPSITYIWDSGEIFEQGFTRLGLQAQFSTWLNEYDTITGNYGLAVELTFKCLDLEENNTFTNIFTFDSNEFFGDVYNFETYYIQENLYDISDFKDYPIVRIRLFPYQRGNFKDTLGEFIPTIDTDDFSTIGPNIFIKDPYICLGMSIEDFSGDSITLITDSSLTYYKKIKGNETVEDRDSANTKIIGARWIHKDLDTDVITTVQENEIPIGYEVRWYRYKLGAHSPDQFAGAHWERFYGSGTSNDLNETTWEYALSEENDIATNSLEVIFIPNINNQIEQIKVIIIKNESATIQKLVASSDILAFTNTDDVRNEATLIDANALSIKFEDDEKGNYFLYNRAGDVGKEEYGEVRVLTAVFDEQEHNINKKAELNIDECSEVVWTFPDQNANTMIVPMDGIGPDAQSKRADENGQFIFNNTQQVGYTIKRHLNNNANQNTVRLDIIKDGLRYSAQIQMLFGTAGTSGSDYTLFIEWENGQNAFNVSPGFSHELSGYIHLMDASGQLIEIPGESQIEASWSAVSYSGLTMGTEKETITVNEELFYPISNNALQSIPPISEGGKINPGDYLVDYVSGVTYYEYNVIQKNFRSTSYDSNKILYRKVAGKKKLEFQPVLTEYIPGDSRSGTIQTINSQRVYFYDNKKRLFIKYNDIFIIDPWDEYQEAETYYEPIVTEDVKYLNDNISLKYLVTKEENNNWKISLTGDNVNINSLYILQITLTNFGDYDLVAYYPISLKNGETKDNNQQTFIVDYIEGPTSVRYATTGETDFNKNAYEIITRKFNSESNNFEIKKHSQNTNTLSGYWRLLYFIENGTYNNITNFLPSLTETRLNNNSNQYIRYTSSNQDEKFNNSPYLEPPGVYFKDAPLYGVQFIKTEEGDPAEGTVLWTQPILVYQDNYPSTTLNKWNGKDILTDNNTGVIVANGLSAGKKESDNTFTGVVLGDWSRTDTDKFITKQTGVYGFNHGAMSYALKDDGTAFFGKDGRGRIYFNGNKAQIYSAHWIANQQEKNGMLIDVDDGYIKIISNDFAESNNNKTRAKITLSGSSPYFEIKDINDNPLIHIGSDSYYLQSSDYNSSNQSGINFNLSAGKLTGYDFTIEGKKSYNITSAYTWTYNENSNEWIRTKTQSPGWVSIKISSEEDDYPLQVGPKFKVSWEGELTSQGGDFSSLSAKNLYAQSLTVYGLEARTGSFTGTVNASGGTFTGTVNVGSYLTAKEVIIKGSQNGVEVGRLGYVESGLPTESGGGTPGIGFSTSSAVFKATGANAGFSCGGAYVSANSTGSVSIGGSRINLYAEDIQTKAGGTFRTLAGYIRYVINTSNVSISGTDSQGGSISISNFSIS